MPDDHTSLAWAEQDDVDFFFETFEDREPAFVFQDETADGQQSGFGTTTRR
jgi:hypothetical protein